MYKQIKLVNRLMERYRKDRKKEIIEIEVIESKIWYRKTNLSDIPILLYGIDYNPYFNNILKNIKIIDLFNSHN